MHPILHCVLTGAVSKIPLRNVLLVLAGRVWTSGWISRVLSTVVFLAALSVGSHILDRPEVIRGEWVDQAFSEVMSRRLGTPVRVDRVRFADWTHVYFGTAEIRDAQGHLLAHVGSGDIRLKQAGIRKDNFFETEIRVNDTKLTREYYRSARRMPIWARLLRRPLLIGRLTAQIRQNDAQTEVQILECQSRDMRLEGELVFRNSGVVHDGLKTSMSPLQFLAAVVGPRTV